MLIKTSVYFIVLIFIGLCVSTIQNKDVKNTYKKPKIAFTFDDGSVSDMANYALEEWNQQLLNNLNKHHLKSILFSAGKNKISDKGKYILTSWNEAGHKIANHTFSHPNFNDSNVTLKSFELELLRNDSIIKVYSNYYTYFRFPYLKEGNTIEKANGFRQFLKEKNYKNGHVSIDASDWYIDSRLLKKLKENQNADLTGFKSYYIAHLFNRAMFYDSLAYQLTNRRINHVILLHHNLTAALFLDDLIQYFKDNNWEVMNADEAYQDKIYNEEPNNIPAGESLIWALAKKSGKFEKVLRYPAEDDAYEKPIMDALGL